MKPEEWKILDDLFWKFRTTLDYETAHNIKFTLADIQHMLSDSDMKSQGYTKVGGFFWTKDAEIIKKFGES